MNRQEKIEFIRELIQNVENKIVDKVDNMPSSWDGRELRQIYFR